MNTDIKFDEFFNCYIDLQTQTFNQIVIEWGKSSVALKKWLNYYHPEILNNKDYSRKAEINADLFLPYRNNGLWAGDDAISRLKIAVKAEVVIIFSNSDLTETEQNVIYKTECLRLWTRINSLVTPFSFEQFKRLLDDTHNYVMNNWDETIQYLQEKTIAFKPKKDQVLYHYTREDFEPIKYEKNLKTAYNKWIAEVWPTLLDKYKTKKLNEYTQTLRNMDSEQYFNLKRKYEEKLNKIQINKIKYRRFVTIIKSIKNGELG